MLLTCTFWALLFLPGYACVRRHWPQAREAGLLYTLGLGYAASFVLLSPLSLGCYALGAPLAAFSCGLATLVLVALILLALHGGGRDLLALVRREPVLPYLLLGALLFLQARRGAWLDGDATFHLGRMRVLLEHGFTNRDIYLAEYHFQHVYHSNLLFPIYASLAQLTGQSYLDAWFYSAAFAKLLVAAGHFVLAYALTGRRDAGYLLALSMITLNAGETYVVYPNTLCVGWLLPMLLGIGLSCLRPGELTARSVLLMAALDGLLAQVHALYAVYGALLLGPALGWLWLRPAPRKQRLLALGAVASLAVASPFLLVSLYGFQSGAPLLTASDEGETPVPPAPMPGITHPNAPPPRTPALAAGGGHLEKVLDMVDGEHARFSPARMGGSAFVVVGFAALVLAVLLARGRRAGLIGALGCALLLALILFTTEGAGLAWRLLKTPFVVARLSTVLSSLLALGIAASLSLAQSALSPRASPRLRRVVRNAVLIATLCAATRVSGHAPTSFDEHVRAALAPLAERHKLLDLDKARRALLTSVVPRGAIVLTTARFARQVVMLCDCYVLAADRGHTRVQGIDKRRLDLVFLNAADTSWELRQRLISHYGLHLVTFERRWHRRYRWAYEHGRVVGSGAGMDVIALQP